jgi:hypothetical protein
MENSYDGLARTYYSELIGQSSLVLNEHQYAYDAGNQRTQQVFTVNSSYIHKMNYTYDKIGQLKTAKGYEYDDTPRLHEQFGYAYDAAWNLSYRTNNALVQTFSVNSLNELSSATRSGTFTDYLDE